MYIKALYINNKVKFMICIQIMFKKLQMGKLGVCTQTETISLVVAGGN